jgi:ubiquinone/menaquinone biosynthesis C-methylase UbiE
VPRARAAADAILRLLPAGTHRLLDLGCGTGLVTAHITRPDLATCGVDPAEAMARVAAGRLPHGAVALGDGRSLPYAAGAFDAVSIVWILHLLDDVPAVVAEAARVLRPGGTLVTTVDKDSSHIGDCDVAALLRRYRTRPPSDAVDLIRRYGRGRVPVETAAAVRRGYFASLIRRPPEARDELAAAIEALPDPEVARPDPEYRLIALHKAR